MTTTHTDQLSRRIEQAIHEHLVASERAAAGAIARAFGAAAGKPRASLAPPTSRETRRRPSTEIAELGERFYRAVCARPGETMVVLAADVGSSPRQLSRPMTQLKRLGRVRSVGQRHVTRYFPLAVKS